LVCGRTGAGKSSLINLILGEEKAPISHYGGACTLEAMRYTTTIESQQFNIIDTVGHNEPKTSQQRERLFETIVNTYELLASLATTGGVHLLVFCFSAGRLTEATRRTYSLFHDFMCGGRVPSVLVITHLEYISPMDSWWANSDNRRAFYKCGIRPKATACVTTLIGQRGSNQQHKYDQSKMKVHELLQRNALAWKSEKTQRFSRLSGKLRNWNFRWLTGTSRPRFEELVKKLSHCGLSTVVAMSVARKIMGLEDDGCALVDRSDGIDSVSHPPVVLAQHNPAPTSVNQNIWDLEEDRESERKSSFEQRLQYA
ncbi:P-loop containing nucleoside triphosphate hydrolase protein, partial [Hygrophoropsis aurantiaca]